MCQALCSTFSVSQLTAHSAERWYYCLQVRKLAGYTARQWQMWDSRRRAGFTTCAFNLLDSPSLQQGQHCLLCRVMARMKAGQKAGAQHSAHLLWELKRCILYHLWALRQQQGARRGETEAKILGSVLTMQHHVGDQLIQ